MSAGSGRVESTPSLFPELLDGVPIAEQPATVFVGPVALGLPLRAGRKETRVVRHVEFGGVTDAPPVGAIVAEQNGVGVNLLEDFQVPPRLNFKDGTAPGAESLDLLPGVGRGEVLGVSPNRPACGA